MRKTIIVSAATVVLTVVVLIGIAWAADILTVDKDGTIRLRVSDTGKVTLNTNEPAQGDMRFTPRSGDPTAPLEGDLWYNATGATLKAKAGADTVNIPGKFTRYAVSKTDGNFTTTSTSWVDITGLSVNFTTEVPNQVVQISCCVRSDSNTAGTGSRIDFNLDGINLSGASYGVVGALSGTASQSVNLSTSYLATVPTSGNHTVTVQTWAQSGTTITIQSNASVPAILQVLKFY